MKKIISLTILILTFASLLPAQQVNFTAQNGRIESGNLVFDIYANVNAGQTWNVGPTNIRMKYWNDAPGNVMTLIPENPASNANNNLSNNNSYGNMTSTKIMNDSAASLNILLLYNKAPYTLAPGSYWLGSLRFSITTQTACFYTQFYAISAVFDNLTPLQYGSGWSFTNPTGCIFGQVGVNPKNLEIPKQYILKQNYPNPFNPVTKVEFALPKSGFVSVKVYDMLGKQVAVLVNEYKNAGTYAVDFNASELSSGTYFYKLEVNGFTEVKKMMVLK